MRSLLLSFDWNSILEIFNLERCFSPTRHNLFLFIWRRVAIRSILADKLFRSEYFMSSWCLECVINLDLAVLCLCISRYLKWMDMVPKWKELLRHCHTENTRFHLSDHIWGKYANVHFFMFVVLLFVASNPDLKIILKYHFFTWSCSVWYYLIMTIFQLVFLCIPSRTTILFEICYEIIAWISLKCFCCLSLLASNGVKWILMITL